MVKYRTWYTIVIPRYLKYYHGTYCTTSDIIVIHTILSTVVLSTYAMYVLGAYHCVYMVLSKISWYMYLVQSKMVGYYGTAMLLVPW